MEIREGYRQTEVGIIPEEWECLSLGDLFKFKNGLNKGKEFFGHGIPIVNYNDVYLKTEIRVKDILGRVSLSSKEIKLFEVLRGDVFFTRTSETPEEVGISSVIIEDVEDTVFSGFLIRARPINKKLDLYYKKYCFSTKSVRNEIVSKCTYTTRALTNGKVLSGVQIIVPPLPEQQAIATALSDIDGLINSLQKLIDKKKKIKQGAMQELLTGKIRLEGFSGEWVEVRLGDIAEVTMGQSPDSRFYNTNNAGIPLVQGNADIDNRKTIIRNYTLQITKQAKKGDIIMTVRAPVGYIGKASYDCCIGRGVCAISCKNDYLYHYFVFIENTWSTLSKGSTFDSVNSKEVNELVIMGPPTVEEQTAIANIFSDMDSEIEALERKLNKYKDIKQGMMQELLTGRIRLLEEAVP